MNYIWEILVRAKQQGIDKNSLFFEQAKTFSPWYEQAFSCLNQNVITDEVVEINSLYRFSDIFQDLLCEIEQSPYCKFLFDVAIHMLAEQELFSGLSVQDFYIQRLICENRSRQFQELDREQQRFAASFLLHQYQTGSSLLMFRLVVTAFYPEALLYQLKESPEVLLLYLGCRQAEDHCMQILQDMFLPIQYQLRIFWMEHFGVLDVEETLHMGAIEIY